MQIERIMDIPEFLLVLTVWFTALKIVWEYLLFVDPQATNLWIQSCFTVCVVYLHSFVNFEVLFFHSINVLMFWKTFYVIINHWTHEWIYLNCRYTNSWLASLWASCKIFAKTGEKASAFTDLWVDIVTNFPQGNDSFSLVKGCPKKDLCLRPEENGFLRIIIGEKRWKVCQNLEI